MRAPTARGGEAPGRCLPKVPLPTRPSDTSHRRLNRDPRFLTARLCSLRLTLLPPTHVNALASTESRCLPSWETCTGALSDLGLALSPGWPARRGAARVHRGLLTATRPLFVRSSRAPSRPRALSRLLQTMLPRARPRTTSNIPNDRKPSLGRLPFDRELPPDGTTAKAAQGQGPRNTVPRRSPLRLLSLETSPQPRSLRAPPVARTVLLPVRSDVGEQRNRQRSAPLHGARSVRVVRRPTSAKRRDVHQPEGPFITRPSASRMGRAVTAWQARLHRTTAPFSPSTDPGEGRSLGS